MRSISMSMRSPPQNKFAVEDHGRHAEHAERLRFIDDAIVLGARRAVNVSPNLSPNHRPRRSRRKYPTAHQFRDRGSRIAGTPCHDRAGIAVTLREQHAALA